MATEESVARKLAEKYSLYRGTEDLIMIGSKGWEAAINEAIRATKEACAEKCMEVYPTVGTELAYDIRQLPNSAILSHSKRAEDAEVKQ